LISNGVTTDTPEPLTSSRDINLAYLRTEKSRGKAEIVLIGREKLTAVRAYIKAIDKVGIAKGVRGQKMEEAQMLAGALLDAEARIGELLPKAERLGSTRGTKWLPEGITKKQSHFFQTLADNKDVIEEVKADAEIEEDLPTRMEVLRRGIKTR
jgi:hypothetical protein